MKNKYKNVKLSRLYLLAMTAVLVISVLIWIILGFRQSKIDVSFYQVKTPKFTGNVRVVQLGDLHLREFGKDNCRLVERISSLEPDIIAITGDMATDHIKKYDVVITLLEQLKDIAPVYYSYGNHEFTMYLFQNSQIGADISKAGATLLSNRYKQIEVNGNKIIIGGICADNTTFEDANITRFFNGYDKEEGFKLLLSHSPEIFDGYMDDHPVDLTLAGDAHGGQIRLPFIGGLYAPGQGLFPEFTDGLYDINGSNLVVTRGLGSSTWVPRFNNNPEIVVIDIGRF